MRALLIRSLAFDPETFARNSKSGDVLPTRLIGTRPRFDLRLTFTSVWLGSAMTGCGSLSKGVGQDVADWIGSAASAPLHVCRDMDGSAPVASSGCDSNSTVGKCADVCHPASRAVMGASIGASIGGVKSRAAPDREGPPQVMAGLLSDTTKAPRTTSSRRGWHRACSSMS